MKHSPIRALALVLVLAGSLTLSAFAQKIGVVDMKAIADRSQRIQSDLKKSQSQVGSQQERLDAKMNEMQKVRQDLNARRSAMTQREVDAQEEKLQTLKDEFDELQSGLNKQITQIQRNVLRPQAERIQKIIAEVAKQQALDLVVDADATIYYSEAIDITPVVVQIFDRQGGDTPATGATEGSSNEKPSTEKETKPEETPSKRGNASGSRNK